MAQYNSKVVLDNGTVLIDLTSDTVTADKMLEGVTAHGKDGAPVVGNCKYDLNTQPATASVAEVLEGKTVGIRGKMETGTMPNREGITGSISTKEESFPIPQGYHDGSGSVSISATEQAKIIPANIKAGVNILGQTGSYGGEQATAQAKTVTPTFSDQKITPDPNFDYMSEVTVKAIPVTYTANSAGGMTVTIGG